LLVTAAKRSPGLPDVPTAAEAGVEGLDDLSIWFGVHVPRDTPDEVASTIKAAFAKVVEGQVFKERIAAMGMYPGIEATAFDELVRREVSLFRGVAESAQIHIE